jgi:Flp pilus assembly protein CpaB
VKRSNRLVILVGVLLAVLAFVGVLFVLNQSGDGTGDGGREVTATVLVATEDIEIGEEVVADMVETAEVAPDAVVGTPFSDPSQLTGRAAIQPVGAGGQVSQETVGAVANANVCIACSLLPGEKAIAFQVDRVTGLDFLVLPGDSIDIVLNQRIPVVQPTIETVNSPPDQQRFEGVAGLEAAPTVKTVLQNKRVIYVSQARNLASAEPSPGTDGGGEAPPEISSVIIIFAGTDQDAELIKLAQSDVTTTGALTAIVRAADDDVNEATTGVTISLLIERYGVPVPNIVLLQTE